MWPLGLLWLSPLWRGNGPLLEQFRNPFTQGWFVPNLIEIGSLVLEIDYLLFYVQLKNISLMWKHHHCRWRAAKFRPMFSTQGLWAGSDLYRATLLWHGPQFFRSHSKDSPIQSPLPTRMGMGRIYSNPDPHGSPISCLLQHTRGWGGPILSLILTG
jgi:hypothetical protein